MILKKKELFVKYNSESKVLPYLRDNFGSCRWFCWGDEGYEPLWTVRCRGLLTELNFYCREQSLWNHALKPTWSFLTVKDHATWAIFLEPTRYWTVKNCTFTFQTINVFDFLSKCCGPGGNHKALVLDLDLSDSVMWYTSHILTRTKIMQNFWFAQLCKKKRKENLRVEFSIKTKPSLY